MRTFTILLLTLSTCASAQLTNGLKGHWTFGSDHTDGSGNGHNATTAGTVAFTMDRLGSPNCAVLFHGDHLTRRTGLTSTFQIVARSASDSGTKVEVRASVTWRSCSNDGVTA